MKNFLVVLCVFLSIQTWAQSDPKVCGEGDCVCPIDENLVILKDNCTGNVDCHRKDCHVQDLVSLETLHLPCEPNTCECPYDPRKEHSSIFCTGTGACSNRTCQVRARDGSYDVKRPCRLKY